MTNEVKAKEKNSTKLANPIAGSTDRNFAATVIMQAA